MCELQVLTCSLAATINEGTSAPPIGQRETFGPSTVPTLSTCEPQPHLNTLNDPPPPYVGPGELLHSALTGVRETTLFSESLKGCDMPPTASQHSISRTDDRYALLDQLSGNPDFEVILTSLRKARDAKMAADFAPLVHALEALKR